MLTLALDIGGTKIAVGLTDPAGELVHTATRADAERSRSRTCLERGRPDDRRRDQGRQGRDPRGRHRLCAGPIDADAGTVSPVNIASWRGFPLRDRIAAAMPGVPVRLAGDGVCMALAEHWRGAGRGASFLLGMVVSTGVGGGLVLDGVPYHGRTGNAGHVGHVVVELDGQPCSCGGRGCVETVAAGPWMTRWALANGWAAPPGADAKTLAEAADAGDPVARAGVSPRRHRAGRDDRLGRRRCATWISSSSAGEWPSPVGRCSTRWTAALADYAGLELHPWPARGAGRAWRRRRSDRCRPAHWPQLTPGSHISRE